MHVLIISEFPPRRGGVADYAAYLADSLIREGVKVSVLTFSDDQLPVKEDTPNGITVYRSLVPGLASGVNTLRMARSIRPDLVHLHLTSFLYNRSFYTFPLLYDLAPLIITAHEVPASHRLVHMTPFIRIALKRSHRLISLSDHVQDLLLSFHGVESSRVVRAPMGIDLLRYNPIHRTKENRELLGWRGKFVVLLVGFLNPGKGVHTLIRAVPLTQIPNLHVVIAGEFRRGRSPSLQRGSMDGYEEFLRSEIVRLDISELVELRGYAPGPEYQLLLANADAFVLPYLYSYQSLSMHCAMASGCPIIASDIAGFREFIAPGRTGLLTPPGDPLPLARGLRWIHDNPEEARGLGAAARRFAVEHFGLQAAARMHVGVYRRALGPPAVR